MPPNERTYISDIPALLAEWHWEKNNHLGYTPDRMSYGSAIKVWWQCEKGHEWEATAANRKYGHCCPVCAKIKGAVTRRKNILANRGSLATNNPTLAAQWHPTKNGNLTPNDITSSYGEKVWWQCKKGHEWEAVVSSRNSGVGCPVCSGHKLVVGINDLATVRPDLAAEWHPTKNGELQPTQFTRGSDERVWWICKLGHEWLAQINNRNYGTNCPVCIGKKVVAGFNDLATINPVIAAEWHPTKNGDLLPQHFTEHSNKKVWWQCSRGHEWLASPANRSKGQGCPKCFGENRTSFPEQAIYYYFNKATTALNRHLVDSKTEIDIYLPEHKIAIEYDGIYYHEGEGARQREERKQKRLSDLGILLIRIKETKNIPETTDEQHVIYSKPGPSHRELSELIKKIISCVNKIAHISLETDVDVERDRYAIYEQYILSEKARSLATQNPTLAAQWHPTKNGALRPEHVSVSSNKKIWWQCEQEHEWQAVINSRRNGIGCPYCAGKRAIRGKTDLVTKNPPLAAQWHPTKNGKLLPYDVTVSSNKFVWWQCEQGHEWLASPANRSKGQGCPICSGHQVLVGYNDLVTINPSLATQWHPTKNNDLLPTQFTHGSDKKVWWQCVEGHEWQATISSRHSGCGCPYCAGQRVIPGENDLLTVNPTLATQWHPTKNGDLLPSNVMAGANRKVWWLCDKGHEWQAVISSRHNGNGCPYCASQKLLVGYNDLATKNPALAAEWHPTKNGDLKPSDVLPSSNKPIWWMCEKGHEWIISANVRTSGNNCPYCSNQKVLAGYNDLATTNPVLASQWHPTKNGTLTPQDFTAGANKKAWWLCSFGHEWNALISSRNQGIGCPVCAGKKTLAGYNDLATLNPYIASQWHPTKNGELLPTHVTPGSNKRVWWKCAEGHEWQATVNKRKRQTCCPLCKRGIPIPL